MIRYDVLWNDLKDSLTQVYSNAVASANFFKNHDNNECRIQETIASRCAAVLASNGRLYREMVELDKMQQNENLTLQEILKELKNLNKGKEDEEDGLLDNHGDGFGDDAGDQGDAEPDQPASAGTRDTEKRIMAETQLRDERRF